MTSAAAPAEWDAQAASLWTAGEHAQAVARAATAAHEHQWRRPALALQCAYYLYTLGDHANAVAILRQQLERTPSHAQVLTNLGVLLSRLRRWDEAVLACRRALEADPGQYTAWDVLARCLHEVGRDDEAARAGTQSLHIKDTQVSPRAHPGWRLPDGSPQAFAAGKHQVIAFTVWGAQPRYLRGALRNLLLAPSLYPGWTVQLHVDASVPAAFVAAARALGAAVVPHPEGPTRERLVRRFLVASDPTVGRFLVRDADSVISLREVLAVREWVASDRWFHVMRDWWTHTDLMLAGMWGGVAGVLPDLAAAFAQYRSPAAETANIDQWFLRDRVWPYARESCLVHDRCFAMPGSRPWPAPAPEGDEHVGQDEHAVRAAQQAAWLGPWLDRIEAGEGRVYQSLPARQAGENAAGEDG